MKKLFLASSFRTLLADEILKKELLELLPKKPKDIVVGHIPNAGDVQENISYIKESTDQLKLMGMKIIPIDLRVITGEKLKDKLMACDVIFVNGGNTFYLLDIIRKSGFDKIVSDLLDQGKIYISASAGTYVACPTILQGAWKHDKPDQEFRGGDKNTFGVTDLTAMNLVPFLISAHFVEEYRPIIEKGCQETNLPIVALCDTQAVKVIGEKYWVVGEEKREFFNGFKENI